MEFYRKRKKDLQVGKVILYYNNVLIWKIYCISIRKASLVEFSLSDHPNNHQTLTFFTNSLCVHSLSSQTIRKHVNKSQKHSICPGKTHVFAKKHENRRKCKYTESRPAHFWEFLSFFPELSRKFRSFSLVNRSETRSWGGKPFGKARIHQKFPVLTKLSLYSPNRGIQEEEDRSTVRNFPSHVFLSCFLCLLPGSLMFSLGAFGWKTARKYFLTFCDRKRQRNQFRWKKIGVVEGRKFYI